MGRERTRSRRDKKQISERGSSWRGEKGRDGWKGVGDGLPELWLYSTEGDRAFRDREESRREKEKWGVRWQPFSGHFKWLFKIKQMPSRF